MNSVVIFISLLALAAAAERTPRIIGGQQTTIEKHPWQISLQIGTDHKCGGSIIKPTHILTTAVCAKYPATDYQIRAGSTSRSSGGQVVRVATKLVHPQYNPQYRLYRNDYDIAILKLASPLTFGSGVAAIKLASARAPDGDKATISGWGTTDFTEYTPDILHVVTVPIVNQESCLRSYRNNVTERMVCSGYPMGGYDACQGDAGGPLVGSNGELLGLVSWGHGCGSADYPGVSTSIPEFKAWIDANSNF